MNPSPEIIKNLLETLVSPSWDGIVDYGLEYEKHDDTGQTFLIVDVIFNIDDYWNKNFSIRKTKAGMEGREIYDTSDMDYEVSRDVKSALKYLGINNSIVEIYVIEGYDGDTKIMS
jgi:hypothetical protein